MFDDISSLENQTEDSQKRSDDEDEPSTRMLSLWSHVIAILIFCLLYFPFERHSWGWLVAIACSYTAFVFAIALGVGLDFGDDFFGDARTPEYVATLFLPHALILMLVVPAAYIWFQLMAILPHWIAAEGHRLSLWEICGIVVVWFAGTREGIWLAKKIRLRVAKNEE